LTLLRLTGCVYDVIKTLTVCVADIVFVIDNSGSIRDNDPPGGNNWQLTLNFIKSLVQLLDVGPDKIRIAVVDFGQIVCNRSKFNC
jgi:von Willebrand factor type A domain